MELPELNTPITLNVRHTCTGETSRIDGIVRLILRERGAIFIGVEITAGGHDGEIITIRLCDDGIPDESHGFSESDDSGEDWKTAP